MAERTFVMVKPDGVGRRLVGEMIRRFERKGLKLVGMKMQIMSEELARTHYAEHAERPFFGDLVRFITSGPTVLRVWDGPSAVEVVRQRTVGRAGLGAGGSVAARLIAGATATLPPFLAINSRTMRARKRTRLPPSSLKSTESGKSGLDCSSTI